MKDKTRAIIWRKSIVDNDFHCKCGKLLWINDNFPDDVLFNQETEEIICNECGLNVAKITSLNEAYKRGSFKIQEVS